MQISLTSLLNKHGYYKYTYCTHQWENGKNRMHEVTLFFKQRTKVIYTTVEGRLKITNMYVYLPYWIVLRSRIPHLSFTCAFQSSTEIKFRNFFLGVKAETKYYTSAYMQFR